MTATKANWNELTGIPVLGHGKMRDGVRKIFTGKSVMVVVNEIQPLVTPEVATHSHPHEQIICIVSGTGIVKVGDETFETGPGDMFLCPPNVPHGLIVTGTEKMVNLDVFSPIREDFLKSSAE